MDHTVDICSTFLSVSDTGVSVAHHWNLFRDIQVWNISYFLTVVCLLLYSFRRRLNVFTVKSMDHHDSCHEALGKLLKKTCGFISPTKHFHIRNPGTVETSRFVKRPSSQSEPIQRMFVCFFHFNAQDTTVCRITSSSDGQYVAVQCDRWVPVCDSVVVGLCTIYNFTNLTRWAPN